MSLDDKPKDAFLVVQNTVLAERSERFKAEWEKALREAAPYQKAMVQVCSELTVVLRSPAVISRFPIHNLSPMPVVDESLVIAYNPIRVRWLLEDNVRCLLCAGPCRKVGRRPDHVVWRCRSCGLRFHRAFHWYSNGGAVEVRSGHLSLRLKSSRAQWSLTRREDGRVVADGPVVFGEGSFNNCPGPSRNGRQAHPALVAAVGKFFNVFADIAMDLGKLLYEEIESGLVKEDGDAGQDR